ncbi:hypothetical protein [Demequina sp. B12]|uniref:hypothetical protein n=1 Tax=Demequina sp. B12 TaxID=2992757 RepID=UPI00237BA309|nr:hypothetical protein [Demequina sp. B12]
MDASAALKFNRQSVAAGVMAGAVVLGACSCSTNPGPDPDISPTTSVEQTVEPTAQPSIGENGEVVADDAWVDNGSGFPPMGITFPAATDENYEFSEEPQGRAEQWIFDNHPDMWERGVRAVTFSRMIDENWEEVPGALVQYIDGERFEGSEKMPLGFRAATTDPNVVPSDTVPDRVKAFDDLSVPMTEAGNIGQGGYEVFITENASGARDAGVGVTDDNDVELIVSRIGNYKPLDEDGVMRFATIDEALAWVEENGYLPGGEGMRPLYPGEVTSLTITEESGTPGNYTYETKVYDSSKDEWVVLRTVNM